MKRLNHQLKINFLINLVDSKYKTKQQQISLTIKVSIISMILVQIKNNKLEKIV